MVEPQRFRAALVALGLLALSAACAGEIGSGPTIRPSPTTTEPGHDWTPQADCPDENGLQMPIAYAQKPKWHAVPDC